MEEITIRKATDIEEMVSDSLQPLLEIAEGKRSIEEWNDKVMDVLKTVDLAFHQGQIAGIQKSYDKAVKYHQYPLNKELQDELEALQEKLADLEK